MSTAIAVPAAFSDFLAEVQETGTPLISPAKFASRLMIEQQVLAELAHVHRNTLRQAPKSAQLQAFLTDAVRVLKAAFDLVGDADKALYWFRNYPIADFDYKTAAQLVSDGKTDAVIRYISSLQAGATG